MTTSPVPPSGQVIHAAVTAAVAAARAQDPAALDDARTRLAGAEPQQVRDILHRLTLGLIEQAFPDGLDADDVRALLGDVLRPALTWLPDLDAQAVILVLTGALSVQDPEAPPVDADLLAVACALTVSHLLGQLRLALEPELVRAFDELRTAQTMELP